MHRVEAAALPLVTTCQLTLTLPVDFTRVTTHNVTVVHMPLRMITFSAWALVHELGIEELYTHVHMDGSATSQLPHLRGRAKYPRGELCEYGRGERSVHGDIHFIVPRHGRD
jgi:hypothetical protein